VYLSVIWLFCHAIKIRMIYTVLQKFTDLLYCLSSSTHPVPGGVLPKPQTVSEWTTLLGEVWNPASVLQTYNLSERKNCLIRFWTIYYMFCISSYRVTLQQARITTSDHVNMIKNYHKNIKQNSDISPIPSLVLQGQKLWNLDSISTAVNSKALWFRNKAIHLNSTTCPRKK